MGKKKSDNKVKPHFRNGKNANKRHPTYIYAKEGDKFKFIGITHSPITKGVDNIPLAKNPNPTKNENSFVRPFVEKEHRSKFGSKLKDWKFDEKDKQKIKKIIKKDNGNKKKNDN